jgi:hypothetical protein
MGTDILLHSFELDIQLRGRDGHWPIVQQYIMGHLHRWVMKYLAVHEANN